MSNQTLIAVPTNLDNGRELRLFLTRLVEKLDVILGYRGSETFTSNPQFAQDLHQFSAQTNTIANRLTQTETTLAEAIQALDEIQTAQTIDTLVLTLISASATYDQANIQAIADAVKETGDKVDAIIGVLQNAGIAV